LRTLDVRAPDRASLAEFLRQLRVSAVDGNPLLVCGSQRLQRYRQAIYLLPQFTSAPPPELALASAETLAIPGVGVVGLAGVAGAGLALPQGIALTLRFRRGRELCQLPGRAGRRSLKVLLQGWGIPPWWRDRVPLLCHGDEILAVGDLALCQSSYFRARAGSGEQLCNLVWQRPPDTVSD
jgi:tRNA(Ile)-lysidine synthase